MRAMGSRSFLPEDVRQLSPGGFEVFVNYTVLELVGVLELLARILQPAADHGLGILAAMAHPARELLDGRRHDEDAYAIGLEPAHLLRTLPVDLEDQVVTRGDGIEDHLARRAVVVAVHL